MTPIVTTHFRGPANCQLEHFTFYILQFSPITRSGQKFTSMVWPWQWGIDIDLFQGIINQVIETIQTKTPHADLTRLSVTNGFKLIL